MYYTYCWLSDEPLAVKVGHGDRPKHLRDMYAKTHGIKFDKLFIFCHPMPDKNMAQTIERSVQNELALDYKSVGHQVSGLAPHSLRCQTSKELFVPAKPTRASAVSLFFDAREAIIRYARAVANVPPPERYDDVWGSLLDHGWRALH